MLDSITTLKHLSSACGGLSCFHFRLCWQTLFATSVILSLYAWCSRLPCYYTMSFGGSPKCLTRTSTERYLRDLEQLMCPPNTSFKGYLATLKSIGQDQCTFVWAKGAVAYRCRTCQILESSAICVDCYKKGDHKHHDYVMYHSESGGCCDCGDPGAWKVSGFCSAHQRLNRQEACVPAHLETCTKNSVYSVLCEFSILTTYIAEPKRNKKDAKETALVYLGWLHEVCAVDPLRKILCSEMVKRNMKENGSSEIKSPLQIQLRTFASMPEDIMEAQTTLYLQMLYDPVFKIQYTEEIADHYPKIIDRIVDKILKREKKAVDHFKVLDSSLDRVSVQLFNVPNMDLIKKKNLLRLYVDVFQGVLANCVARDTGVVDVKDPRIENKVKFGAWMLVWRGCLFYVLAFLAILQLYGSLNLYIAYLSTFKIYLRPQGDLRLIVTHTCVAQYMLEEQTDVFATILDALAGLQWMNPYSLEKYVNFDNAWSLAIQLEMNTMAIIFQLVQRCYSLSSLEESVATSKLTLISAAKLALARLRKYVAQESTLKLLKHSSMDIPLSFHIPLHRALSAILAKLVLLPWEDEKEGFLSMLEMDLSENEVLALMEHPLRITVWMAQIRAKQWSSNSEDFSRLELIYRGSFWHDQSMDMDVLLLQFCVVARENMERAIFVRMAELFQVQGLVCCPSIKDGSIGRLKEFLVQDFMRLILLVVRERRNTGMEEDECLRHDVIQWLCVRDQTHSQLSRAISAIPVDPQRLSSVLEKVALFHVPKVQERGFFQLKAECWQEFDPLFAHFYLNELEDATERAITVGKLPYYWRIKHPCGAKAPYNRLINLIHTRECHQLLWNMLKYVSFLVSDESSATVGEALGVLALQLMGIAVQDRRERASDFPMSPQNNPAGYCNDIFQNVYLRPYYNKEKESLDWGYSMSEYPSLLDILGNLQQVKNAPRLVDSIDFVLHFLPGAEQKARVSTSEDNHLKLKKERQDAIMAQFRAKQSAFLEQCDVSDDEYGEILDETMEARSSNKMLSTDSSSIADKANDSLMEASEVHECAFCRSECGGNDKAIGWIALIQRYNMPSVVMSKGVDVKTIRDANEIVKEAIMNETNSTTVTDTNGKQLVIDLGRQIVVDYQSTEHVRCCGHQMHQECFQSYHKSLAGSYMDYQGENIIQRKDTEFLCPICRRLANALLPVVHQASYSGMLQFTDINHSVHAQTTLLEKFWETWKNLRGAIDEFAFQSVRVRRRARQEIGEEMPVLWRVLAGNIIHSEVETRELLPELASASSTSTQIRGQSTWGEDTGHWIAMQELGKLAMISNTSNLQTGQEMRIKKKTIEKLEGDISQILDNIEKFERNYLHIQGGGISKLTEEYKAEFKLLLDILGSLQNDPCWDLHCPDSDVAMEEEPTQQSGKAKELDPPACKMIGHVSCLRSRDNETVRDYYPVWPSSEESRMPRNHVTGGLHDGDETENKRGKFAGDESQVHSMYPDYNSYTESDKTDRHSNSHSCKFFDADPFGLLIILLSSFPRLLEIDMIYRLVKVTYLVVATQALLAWSSLEYEDDEYVKNIDWGVLLQYICLPFLRRSALLVQIITQQDFQGEHLGAGRKAMDAEYLLQELGLIDSYRTFTGIGELSTLSHFQQLYLNISPDCKKPLLKQVPSKLRIESLPSVFQELLLRSIQETCHKCKRIAVDPAFCLVCGEFFCWGTQCCDENTERDCMKHAQEEGAGIGMFLSMRSTQLIIIRGNRVSMAPSLYLDQHGEEDNYIRRTQLLHLSKLRLNEVRRLWVTAGFDHATHILHNSQLKF